MQHIIETSQKEITSLKEQLAQCRLQIATKDEQIATQKLETAKMQKKLTETQAECESLQHSHTMNASQAAAALDKISSQNKVLEGQLESCQILTERATETRNIALSELAEMKAVTIRLFFALKRWAQLFIVCAD